MKLTELEEAVLRTFLDGDHPVLAALRDHLAACWVSDRYYTGVGFYTDLEMPPETRAAPIDAGHIGDVTAQIEGLDHGAGFILFIADGRLSLLEGFSYGGDWPSVIGKFTVRYEREERDLSDLLQAPRRK
ncbi:MAG TPA: hypothetical protein VMS76_05145 [Planctomycetota bacterium]|nr:hypothetical protein [Planctomycetota bacterium]